MGRRKDIFRPDEYKVTPTMEDSFSESCVNRFRLKIDALSASAQRMSFAWKAPGLGLLQSPQAYISMDFKIVSTAARVGFRDLTGPLFQRGNRENVGGGGAYAGANDKHAVPVPIVCLAEGDAIGQALTSYQLVFNGATLSQVRMNQYKSTLDRCWFGKDVWKKRFYQSGGPYSDWDGVAVSGAVQGADNQGADDKIVTGMTQDSALKDRIRNLMNAVSDPVGDGAAAGNQERVITIRWQISSGTCSTAIPYHSSSRGNLLLYELLLF